MASTRLRKAFRYPIEDGSDDEAPNELDEQEQDNLIARLRKDDEKKNYMYKRIFLVLPIASATIFVPTLISSPTLQIRLSSLLAISSLLCTALILFAPPDTSVTQGQFIATTYGTQGPLQVYISYLNGGLSLLVGLNAFFFKGRKDVEDGFWLLFVLPGAVFFVIVLARRTMFSVDFRGLEELKYPYKGA